MRENPYKEYLEHNYRPFLVPCGTTVLLNRRDGAVLDLHSTVRQASAVRAFAMQHYRINPAALKKTLRSSSTYSTSFFRCTNVSNDCGGRRYTSTHSSGTSDASGVEVLASCAARKQVRVSLDSVLDVSMGKRPWRSSFSEANPELHQHAGAPKGIPQQDQRQQGQARTISRPEVAATSCEQQRRTTVLPAGGEGQLQSAQYLHRELPVRLASAVLELDKASATPSS